MNSFHSANNSSPGIALNPTKEHFPGMFHQADFALCIMERLRFAWAVCAESETARTGFSQTYAARKLTEPLVANHAAHLAGRSYFATGGSNAHARLAWVHLDIVLKIEG